MPDDLLAVRAAAGAREAFAQLVERHGARVRSVIERRVGDHHLAMDLCQEVWIRAFRALPRFRPGAGGGNFRPWLYTIAFNLVRDDRRRQGVRTEGATEDTLRLSPASDRYDPSGRVEELEAIDEALRGVPEPFGEALHLVDVVGLAYRDAAQALGCSLGTLKSRVNRGRLAFRDLYLKFSGDAPAGVAATRNEDR